MYKLKGLVFFLQNQVQATKMVDLIHFACCVVDSDNTTYYNLYCYRLFVLPLAKLAKRCGVALSSYRPVSSDARQTARCRVARGRGVALSLCL
jgi:hypothetical protein